METKYLDQLVDFGYAEKVATILNGKITIKIRSLAGDDQLALEQSMNNMQGNAAYIVHTYSIKLLSYILKEYKTEKETKIFTDPLLAEDFIRPKAAVIIDALIKEHELFTKELKELATPEKLDENFTTTPPTEPA